MKHTIWNLLVVHNKKSVYIFQTLKLLFKDIKSIWEEHFKIVQSGKKFIFK